MKSDTEIITANKKIYQSYESNRVITWCGGCGNFAIQNALKQALTIEKIVQDKAVFCFDVGCSGNGSDKIDAYTVHGLHGRVIPLATGIKLANPNLKVIAHGGDGATLNEGINHLIHAVRNNVPVVFLHHNNSNFALTTGQASAATKKGQKMNSSPQGSPADPINAIQLLLSLNPGFVARTFSGDMQHMRDTMREAINHNGFAFIDIIQTCPTYDKKATKAHYWDKIKYLKDTENYDYTNLEKARQYAQITDKKIYLGTFYKKPETTPPQTTIPYQEVKHISITKLLENFK